MGRWSRGYDAPLTRERSQVRFLAGPPVTATLQEVWNKVMNIVIREADEDDSDRIADLLLKMQDEEKKFDPLLKSSSSHEMQESAKRYAHNAVKNNDRITLVAEVDNRVVGFIIAKIFTYGGIYDKERAIYISDLYTEKEYRGKGIGSMLLHALEDEARKRDIRILELDTYAESENSIQFYSRRGYKAVDIRMRKVLG